MLGSSYVPLSYSFRSLNRFFPTGLQYLQTELSMIDLNCCTRLRHLGILLAIVGGVVLLSGVATAEYQTDPTVSTVSFDTTAFDVEPTSDSSVTVTAAETVEPNGETTVTIETEASSGTVVEFDPGDVSIDLTAAEASVIENNRVEFLDATAGDSTYEITVDLTNSIEGDTVVVDAWVNAAERSDATATAEEALISVEERANNDEHPSGIDQDSATAVAALTDTGDEISGGDLTILRGDLIDGDNVYDDVTVTGGEYTLLRGWLLDDSPS